MTLALATVSGPASTPALTRGDGLFEEYFRAETARVAERCLAEIHTREDWLARRDHYREQLQEMLGLKPWPERTDLKPVITGRIEHEQFVVEKLHFQSRPGLYVTANLYLPKARTKPAPAILYVCGHSRQVKDGVSLGNKTGYQHHGAWFARNGYVCLTIDTLQLGEIEGIHHGTYRYNLWWWNSRGYTPAGVEAWNGIRALDYLATRPEVDPGRIGITGRSGGGAYSWFVAALDERVKVAVPVAGITDLRNHVVDGAVRGHCDCMYIVNTRRWDYAQLAALVAPRPLLIGNSDKDRIFPLDGVVRLHRQVRQIYDLNKASDKLGLLITEGPHKDTQDLQVPTFRWFNRFLKEDDTPVEMTAVKFFEPTQLKVFETVPADAANTNIHETFVPAFVPPPAPSDPAAWQRQRRAWMDSLREQTFAGWPERDPGRGLLSVFTAERDGVQLAARELAIPGQIPLRLYLARRAGAGPIDQVILRLLDEAGWREWLITVSAGFREPLQDELAAAGLKPADEPAFADWAQSIRGGRDVAIYFAPRGIGPTALSTNARHRIETRRRFMLLGQTLDGMRVWDVRQALQTARAMDDLRTAPVTLQGRGDLAVLALYASLFEPAVAALELADLPATHRLGPDLLNVLRFMDIPQAVALAAERSPVRLIGAEPGDFAYATQAARQLGWPEGQLLFRNPPGSR